jgi:hypothetical protein
MYEKLRYRFHGFMMQSLGKIFRLALSCQMLAVFRQKAGFGERHCQGFNNFVNNLAFSRYNFCFIIQGLLAAYFACGG